MRSQRQAGQSLIESCLVIALICLVFFGLFQISQIVAAKEIMYYAAGRGTRAKTVGFNRFMVYKTVRVGAIPAAGRLLTPTTAAGPKAQHSLEAPRIPLYLGAQDYGQLAAILDYKDWDSINFQPPAVALDGTLHLNVEQYYALRVPFHRAFYAADFVQLTGESSLDDHYPLYLDDWGL